MDTGRCYEFIERLEDNEMHSIEIVELTEDYKEETERIAAGSWGGVFVAAHHEVYDIRALPCYIALSEDKGILGYCYYCVDNESLEIMAVESLLPGSGIGTALIKACMEKAEEKNCARILVNTTNDNTHALRFYQRRGFTICAIRLNELDYLRTLKPTIPQIGDDGIPLQHEIELEIVLKELS
jgi:GNAT superfamily N-acetyltransferase